MNSLPKYVVSSTLQDPDWNNSTVLKSDVVNEVSKLKQEVAVLADWLAAREPDWRARIATVAGSISRLCHRAGHPATPHHPSARPLHVVKLGLAASMTFAAASSRTPSATPRSHRRPLYGICRVLRRRRDRLSVEARPRLETGLIAGDPTGETTLDGPSPWT